MLIPRVMRDTLNRVSLVTVMALSIALTAWSGAQIGQHYGWRVPWAPVAKPNTSGIAVGAALAAEAGIVEPGFNLGSPAVVIPSPSVAPPPAAQPVGPRDFVWIPVLMYHYVRVAPAGDTAGYNLSVTPSDFSAQMHYLKQNGFTTLTMRDVDGILLHQKPVPPKPVALTFDDGYADFYKAAAPTMRDLGITATNYIPTQLLGDSKGAYMTWPQVQQLDALGFEMAAHSQFHTDVSRTSAARARTEIFGAKLDLENHLGHPVLDWAYPYGGYSASTIALCREAGYVSAATTVNGGWHDAAQLQTLTRIRVGGGESLSQYAANLVAR